MALTGKYAQLRDAIREAVLKGEIAEEVEWRERGDGGTCNFDSPVIYLPRWKRNWLNKRQRKRERIVGSWDTDFGRGSFSSHRRRILKVIRERKTQKQCMTISNRWDTRQACTIRWTKERNTKWKQYAK